MTDTNPPADLGSIWVVGQRRVPGGSFPSGGGGGGGDVGSPVSEHDNEQQPEQPLSNPCAQVETAREWDGDAAAVEALRRAIAAAAAQNNVTHNLSNREYGGMICEHPDHTFSISPIQWGDPIFDEHGNWVNAGQQPSVNVNFNACGGGALPFAMFHSHPGTGPAAGLPSIPDATWVNAINNARGDSLGRIYIFSIGDASSPFKVWVYNSTNVQNGALQGVQGPEVNPNATPCSEISIR